MSSRKGNMEDGNKLQSTSHATKQYMNNKLPQDFFDQVEAPKPDRGQNKEEDDEYQKFEEELAQDLSGLKRSYVEEEYLFDERETKLQEHEQNEMKQRIQHLKELLKQRKRAKQDEGVTERIEDDPAVTEGEVENNFVNTDSDEDWVLNWKRKKRLEG